MNTNHDKILIKVLSINERRLNNWKVKKALSLPNVKEYIINRYDDSFSYKETLMRMKLNIKIHPKCSCGNYVRFSGRYDMPFSKYCCQKCNASSTERKEKTKLTSLQRYGVESPNKAISIKNKKKSIFESKYGVDNPSKLEFVKDKKTKTTLKHYGVVNPSKSNIVKERKAQTALKHYGVDNPSKSDIIKRKKIETFMSKYGVSNAFQTKTYTKEDKERIQQKINITKRKNHTFNVSKPEEELFLYIKSKFPKVERQYNDKIRYPYNCDFYIPDLDYFIELQGYYTHGKRPFDPNSKEDLQLVEQYKKKYGTNCQLITIWTMKDVEKRNTAKSNNLNFKEVWSLEEGKAFINDLVFLNNKRNKT